MQIIPKVSQRHRRARIVCENAVDLDPFLIHDEDHANSGTKSLPTTSNSEIGIDCDEGVTTKHSRAQKLGFLNTKRWRFGLHAGLFASIVVLLSNMALLLTGIIARDDAFKGISTIAKGETKRITTMSTAYHVLINILSTILLTSTNYAMQILCSPTRCEVEKAHACGQWLDIGIMSVHNLRHIDRKRAIVWMLLAISSAPLHLFYNSSIFGAYGGQDYEVTFSAYNSSSENLTWKTLENKDWSRIYATSWVPGYSDLQLIVDQFSFEIQVLQNWSYTIQTPTGRECGWSAVRARNETLTTIDVTQLSGGTIVPNSSQSSRFFVDADELRDNEAALPKVAWPAPYAIAANGSRTLDDYLKICPDGGWLTPATAFHVAYARAKANPYANRVQVAIPFLAIVILSNIVKIFGIFFAIRMRASEHLMTGGDAIASFLERPEPETKNKCTLHRPQLCSLTYNGEVKPWRIVRKPTMIVLGGTRAWSTTIAITSFSLAIAAISAATNSVPEFSSWGTASTTIVSFTSTTFDARGILLVAFLANLPQVGLSLLYFSINRICTSICFATEWNRYTLHPKGLRLTHPTGKQRGTHFLQLPLRWAIPLTLMSGLLHWLLSQSIFLVRQELRTRDGELYPGSTCACGYSVLSLLTFTLSLLTLLLVVLYLLLRPINIHLPPARHCSLVISAACHPPEDEVDAHLGEVRWGVTELATEEHVGHCTFTSREVTTVQPGALYA